MPYALVTGATSGIGRAYAEALGSLKYDLVLCGRREEILRKVAAEINETYEVKTEVFLGNLGSKNETEKLLDFVQDFEIEWLVNNAGFGTDHRFFEEDPEILREMISLHTETPVILCHQLVPPMIQRGKGYVVNVSSLASQFPLPGSPLYTSTKAMLHVFTQALALEVMARGVRVQSLLPGFTHTDFHSRLTNFDHPQKSQGLVRWEKAGPVVEKSYKSILGKGWKRVTLIPGFSNKLLRFLVTLLPWPIFRALAKRV